MIDGVVTLHALGPLGGMGWAPWQFYASDFLSVEGGEGRSTQVRIAHNGVMECHAVRESPAEVFLQVDQYKRWAGT